MEMRIIVNIINTYMSMLSSVFVLTAEQAQKLLRQKSQAFQTSA